jgi:hypothetical protein
MRRFPVSMGGFLAHEQEECGTREHPSDVVRFGKWFLDDTPWNMAHLHGNTSSLLAGKGETRSEIRYIRTWCWPRDACKMHP